MAFPVIEDKNYSEDGDNNSDVREILDYASQQWALKAQRRARIDKYYNSYNGLVDESEINSIVKTTGKQSKTKYVKYRLGRSKLKQLHGEFLEIPIEATVRSTNRDAQNERMKKYKRALGMAVAKPYIEQARAMGYNVYEGIQIPDKNDKSYWNINNFKLANEIVMNTILEDKLQNERLKTQFYANFVDLTIAAEVFGKVERNADGIDTYRFIPAKYALYEESVYDPFLERTPYKGEVRQMYYHEILSNPEIKLSVTAKQNLKQLKDSYSASEHQGHIENINGHPAFNVYTVQWKGLETVYLKTSPAKNSSEPYKRILSEEYYNDNRKKITADVRAGKYNVEKFYRETVWTASKIAEDIYTQATKEENIIQRLNENGKFRADFDYCGMLFATVGGYRVSLQEIIYELERIYDDIRFMINKEIRKIRGDTLIYDDAFLPKNKRWIDILHSISEDGVVRFNSSVEGNRSSMETESNKVGIGALNLGQSQSLVILLNQAMDIERVMDRITGMNQPRQGLERPTSTATSNINNIEASRSMTYDMFFFMKDYLERVLMKLCEKTKLNKVYEGMDSRMFVLSDEEIQYLISTENLIFHNYAVTVTDGRKEKAILDKIEQWFPQEINAGMIRTKDVAKFYMETNFAKAIKILDQAHDELAAIREKEIKASQEAKMDENEKRVQIAQEDREDQQEHDHEMEVLRTEGKKEVAMLNAAAKATQDFQKNLVQASMKKADIQRTNPFES